MTHLTVGKCKSCGSLESLYDGVCQDCIKGPNTAKLLTTIEKYHHCKDKPKDANITLEDNIWSVSNIQCFVLMINYCPWCGKKLSSKES